MSLIENAPGLKPGAFFVVIGIHTGLNPHALKVQAPAFAGEDKLATKLLVPAKAGNCFFEARGFSPVIFFHSSRRGGGGHTLSLASN